MSIRCQVLEYSVAPVVDGVIKGVKIVGTRSSNGRNYPQPVLDLAIPLYETTAVYMMHPDKREKRQNSRQHSDHFGNLQNVHARFDGKIGLGLFGDLHVKQSHQMAQFVLESDGSKFGLSHNIIAEMNDDRTEVLKILEVNSVDLVDDPATTTNLFEGVDDMTLEEFKEASKATNERFAALEGKLAQVLEAVEKRPTPRLSMLESDGDDGDGKPLPTFGHSHEAFGRGLRGITGGTRQ